MIMKCTVKNALFEWLISNGSPCSIPFSTDDLSDAHQLKDFSDVKPAAELLKSAAFQFLQDWGCDIFSILFRHSISHNGSEV